MSGGPDLRQTAYNPNVTGNSNLTETVNSTSSTDGATIVNDLNSAIVPPLTLQANNPASLILNIGNITSAGGNSKNRTIQPISGTTIPTFTSGTITLSSSGSGTATPSTGSALSLGMTASQFLKVVIYLTSTGTLTLVAGTAASTLAAATLPSTTVTNALAIGYLVVRTDASNNTQNIAMSDIYQFIGDGAGSGGLTSTLNSQNVLIGNASNAATATNTSLIGDVKASTNSQTVTVTIAAPGVFTATAHGMALGDKFYLTTTGALPSGLTASTTYYAANITTNTFSAATSAINAALGTYITTSGSQSGTHTLFDGGLVIQPYPNATNATHLGQFQYTHGTNYNGGNAPTVSVTNLSAVRGAFVPYQVIDDKWRMKFNIALTVSASTTSISATVNGVSLPTSYPSGIQAISAFANNGNSLTYGFVQNTNTFQAGTTTASTLWALSGDIELNSKPTWAY